MTGRARPAVALFLVALTGTVLSWPAAVNAAVPVAVDDPSMVVQKNAAATPLDVLANDTTVPADQITSTTAASHGSVSIAVDGRSVTYTPSAGYTGTDSFTYTVTNTPSGPDTATVTVKVNAPPVAVDDPGVACQPPTAFGGAFPIVEDRGQFVLGGPCGLFSNDTDSDGTIVDWQPVDQPLHGDLLYVDPSLFAYTPDADYSTIAGDQPGGAWVSDSFTYRVKDNNGAWSQPATMRIWIPPINDPPSFVSSVPTVEVAEDSGPFDESWAPYVSAGPPNESGQTVTFQITSGETHGVVSLFSVPPTFTADGHLTFTPGPNEHGYALITGYLKDDGGLEDYDLSGSQLPVPPDDSGDQVTFMITVDSVNDAPVATDDSATVAEDSGANVIAVRGNDTDPDSGTTLTVTGTTNPSHGAVAITGGGTGVSYTPNANYNGSDSFTYTLSDGTLTDTGTVNVTITAVNDPPTANNDTTTVAEDAAATAITVLSNDSISPDTGETLTITTASTSSHGTVVITGGGSGLTYQPNANYNGSDSFTYTISDGGLTDTATVDITITAVNDPPTATNDTTTVSEDAAATAITVLSNDSIAPDTGETLTITARTNGAHGTVVITGGGTGVTYKPGTNYYGSDSFTYTISDGTLTNTATVNVSITPVNDNPVAANDALTVIEDQPAATTVSVLSNDVDVDGDTPTVTDKTDGAKGVVVISPGGTGLTYKPNANQFGSDAFTYTISDGHGGSATATVNVTITPVNDAPNAVDDGLGPTISIGTGSGPVPIDVLANDTSSPDDPETLRITSVTQGANGAVAIIDRGGRLTYDPAGTTTGIDVFQYTISDGHGGSDTGTVQVMVGTDATGPVVGAPVVTVTPLTRAGTTRLVVTWVASDPESGIASSLLQLKRDGAAAWTTVAIVRPNTTRTTLLVASGHTYQFHVRATNGIGMASAFKIGALVSV